MARGAAAISIAAMIPTTTSLSEQRAKVVYMPMTPDDYKQAALRTENTPHFINHARRGLFGAEATSEQYGQALGHDRRLSRMIHAILGMITELGELCDPVKRHLIYGAELNIANMGEEMGDREWYSSGLMLDALDMELTDIWERNIAKLRARFPDKFTSEKALNRDLGAEQKALVTPTTVELRDELVQHQSRNDLAMAGLIARLRDRSARSSTSTGDLLHEAANAIAAHMNQPIQHGRIGIDVGDPEEALQGIRDKLAADFAPTGPTPMAIHASVTQLISEYRRLSNVGAEQYSKLQAYRKSHTAMVEAAQQALDASRKISE